MAKAVRQTINEMEDRKTNGLRSKTRKALMDFMAQRFRFLAGPPRHSPWPRFQSAVSSGCFSNLTIALQLRRAISIQAEGTRRKLSRRQLQGFVRWPLT
jgi:hypothetical protein